MDRKQLEMKLQSPLALRRAGRCRRRTTRARWWFDQMRQAADEATNWPAPQPVDTRSR
jgi:hypothetical protein